MRRKRCFCCHRKFSPKRKDAFFCSSRCRVSHHRKRNSNETDNSGKLILSLCDYSGGWSAPYKRAGYQVELVDIKHGQDVRLLAYPGEVHGILAAPPCTHLASSGAVHWKRKGEEALLEAMAIFDACCRLALFCKPKFWAFENPKGRLPKLVGPPKLWFHPYQYGDPYQKKTGIWGNFISPLPKAVVEVPMVPSSHHSIDFYLKSKGYSLGKNRATLRSITPAGFAQAFFEANR